MKLSNLFWGCNFWVKWCVLFLFLITSAKSDDVNSKRKAGGTTTSGGNGNGTYNGKSCNASSVEECWAKLPTMKEPNIPTTSKEVEIACKAFNMGMDCVDDYAKRCLNQKQRQQLRSSVKGASDIFTFLCKDERFRAEFLSHATCYKKVSRKWDDCSSHFIEALKKADQREPLAVCCIRLRFLQCVSELAQLHCSKDAEIFLKQMGETLVTSNVKGKAATECLHIKYTNCSQSSGACSMKNFANLPSTRLFGSFLESLQYILSSSSAWTWKMWTRA